MIYENFIFPLDYVIISISFIIIIFSFLRGFINSLLSLLTWIGSIIITIYSYKTLSLFITNQLNKISLFNEYDQITNGIAILLSIPFIFRLTLFILKRIRTLISRDIDKKILGLFFDKLFGVFYGVLFSYLLSSTILYSSNNFVFLSFIYNFLLKYSFILRTIDFYNNIFFHFFISYNVQ